MSGPESFDVVARNLDRLAAVSALLAVVAFVNQVGFAIFVGEAGLDGASSTVANFAAPVLLVFAANAFYWAGMVPWLRQKSVGQRSWRIGVIVVLLTVGSVAAVFVLMLVVVFLSAAADAPLLV